jgi:hypothetical protein
MFSGLPDPDPLVQATDPAPDPDIYHQAKKLRKTLISSFLWLLYDFLFLKNVNVASKSNKQKNLIFVVAILKVKDENSRIRIRNRNR